MNVKGKVVLITGGTRGLGRLLVDLFSEAGAQVAFCSRQRSDLQTIEARLTAANRPAIGVPCDVRVEEDVVRMVHRVHQRFQRIDALIHCAAVYGPSVPISRMAADPWRDVIETNLTGVFLVSREAIPCLTRAGGASIIIVSNCPRDVVRPEWGAYLASKWAVEGLTAMLAAELADQKIRVNCVDPSVSSKDARNAMIRAGDRRAELFLWLVSDASRATTGQRIAATEYQPSHAAEQIARA